MERHHLWAACGVLVGATVMATWAAERDEKRERGPQQITLTQLPARARTALLKLTGDNKLLGIVTETDEGVVTYKGVWRVGGKPHSATLTVEGALVATEETVDGEDVPPAVRKAADKLLPGAHPVVFEKATKVSFELFGTINGHKKLVEVSPAGTRHDHEGRD